MFIKVSIVHLFSIINKLMYHINYFENIVAIPILWKYWVFLCAVFPGALNFHFGELITLFMVLKTIKYHQS